MGTDKPESMVKGKDIKFGAWKVYELEMNNTDYTVLDDFDSSKTLDIAVMVKKDTRTEVTVTITLNRVTVADAGVTVTTPVLLFVVGIPA